jgi:hypothetical protein
VRIRRQLVDRKGGRHPRLLHHSAPRPSLISSRSACLLARQLAHCPTRWWSHGDRRQGTPGSASFGASAACRQRRLHGPWKLSAASPWGRLRRSFPPRRSLRPQPAERQGPGVLERVLHFDPLVKVEVSGCDEATGVRAHLLRCNQLYEVEPPVCRLSDYCLVINAPFGYVLDATVA